MANSSFRYICHIYLLHILYNIYAHIYVYIYTHTLFNIELCINTLFWWFWNVREATLPSLPTPKTTCLLGFCSLSVSIYPNTRNKSESRPGVLCGPSLYIQLVTKFFSILLKYLHPVFSILTATTLISGLHPVFWWPSNCFS